MERRFLEAFIEYKATHGLGFEPIKPDGPETALNLQYTLGIMDLNSGKIPLATKESINLAMIKMMLRDELHGVFRDRPQLSTAEEIRTYLTSLE